MPRTTGRPTLKEVQLHPEVRTYVNMADEFLAAMGFTEHGLRHCNLVAEIAQNILRYLNAPARQVELAGIAGFLHDIGNVVSRANHGQTGAVIAWRLLRDMGMHPEEVAHVVAAIGNHEEEYGAPVNTVAAALILADKSDVHRTRVRNRDLQRHDIHDRVNYAAKRSFVRVDAAARLITLELTIDPEIAPVMEYFEIYFSRMTMCRRAAERLGCRFAIVINGVRFL
ncbi:MAG: HD domain-containing protein [Clostridia bacterium]|nr:HD domain-containing protein [Clostridia bacterium]